jgi:hypothetical protein
MFDCYTYNFYANNYITVSISNNGEWAAAEWFQQDPGDFVIDHKAMYCGCEDDLLFADGTAQFSFEAISNPMTPYFTCLASNEYRNSYSLLEPNSIIFDGNVIITIDYGEVTPTEEITWGSIKSIYR